jgi:hypothetical protein
VPDAKVEFRGVKEFVAGLKAIDADLPKEMRSEFLGVATKIAGEVAAVFPHGATGRASGSVKPRAGAKAAGIAIGGAAAPYAPWLDYGGTVGRGHKVGVGGSGSVTRPFIKGGRYLYPTIIASHDEIEKAAAAALVKVARSAGFTVKGG